VNKCDNGKVCLIKTDSKSMEANNEKEVLVCSLTNVEMKERMKTIEKFKSLIKEKKEIENGMVFQFEGNNKNLEEILDLMKLERQCCSFLTFDLKVQKESKPIQLTISGPEGTKDFLNYELGL
jgi:hypothetical protein